MEKKIWDGLKLKKNFEIRRSKFKHLEELKMNSIRLQSKILKSETRNLGVKNTGLHLKHSFWNEKNIWSEFKIKGPKSGAPLQTPRTPTRDTGWLSTRGSATLGLGGAGRGPDRGGAESSFGFNLTWSPLKNRKWKPSHFLFSSQVNSVFRRPPSNSASFSVRKKSTHRKFMSTGSYYIFSRSPFALTYQ